MRQVLKIVVHCSASPDALDVGEKEIDQWHLKRGFLSPSGVHCGYHFIIRRNGTVEVGRMVNEAGAHVEGQNHDSVGVCLVGTHEFNESQVKSLKRVVDGLLEEFPGSGIFGHREFASAKAQHKTCPNFDVHSVLGI